MRNAIGWSHDLLLSEEQQLFQQLSVFVDGFTLEVAKVVADDTDLDTVEGVETLVMRRRGQPRGVVGGEPR